MVITTITPEQVIVIDNLVVETTAIVTTIDQVKPAVEQAKRVETVDMDTMVMVVVVEVMIDVDIKSTYEPDGLIRTN